MSINPSNVKTIPQIFGQVNSFIFCQTGLSPQSRVWENSFELRRYGIYIAPQSARLGGFQGLEDFQRNFGYVGTWLNISKDFGRTSDLIRVYSRCESNSLGVGSMSHSRNRLEHAWAWILHQPEMNLFWPYNKMASILKMGSGWSINVLIVEKSRKLTLNGSMQKIPCGDFLKETGI